MCYIAGVASNTSFVNRMSGSNLGKTHSLKHLFAYFIAFISVHPVTEVSCGWFWVSFL